MQSLRTGLRSSPFRPAAVRHRPFLALALVAGVGLAASAATRSPARAADEPTTVEWTEHTLVVTATSPGGPVVTETPGTPSTRPRYFCGWFGFRVDRGQLVFDRLADPARGQTYLFHCWTTDPWFDPHPAYPVVAVFDPAADPPGPLVTTPEVARYAVNQIDFATPTIATSPADTHVVGVSSWFAIESQTAYAPVSAQAGPVWATVRPELLHVTWQLGDGTTLRCDDAGRHGDPTEPRQPDGSCRHVYQAAPGDPEQSVALTATVTWTVWQQTDRTHGGWDEWGTVQISGSASHRIIDLRAAIN